MSATIHRWLDCWRGIGNLVAAIGRSRNPAISRMTVLWVAITLAIGMMPSIAMADERRTGFFDLYGGLTGLLESDVPDWKFGDLTPSVGARVGLWINDNWAVTLRTWYFQADAKQRATSPSDLAFLGVSLELLARWQVDPRWAVYGSLGPAMVVNTLDLQRGAHEEDARSVGPGVSAGAGIEAHLVGPFKAFTEFHGGLSYPSFRFSDRTIAPRFLNLDGVVGVRVGF